MPRERPTSVLVIAILHFVFGGFGLIVGICGGAVQLAGGSNLFTPAAGPQAPRQTISQKDMEKHLEQKLPHAKLIEYGSLGLGGAISILMILSGVGLLRMASWGRMLSILYAFLSISEKVFGAVFAFAFTIPVFKEFLKQVPIQTPQDQMIVNMMQVSIIAGPIIQLLSMIYPIVVLIIMLRPGVAAAFRGESVGSDGEEDFGPYDRADPGEE